MCQHIALINKGKNVLYGEVQTIKNRYKENLFNIQIDGVFPEDMGDHFEIVKQNGQFLTIKVDTDQNSNAPLQYLIGKGLHIKAFNEIMPTFDEIFIRTVEGGNES